jgi:hypothetical protein
MSFCSGLDATDSSFIVLYIYNTPFASVAAVAGSLPRICLFVCTEHRYIYAPHWDVYSEHLWVAAETADDIKQGDPL